MSKNKHLSLDDRSTIQLMLDNKEFFSSIASSCVFFSVWAGTAF